MAWEFIKAFAGSNKVKTLPRSPIKDHQNILSHYHLLITYNHS